MKYFLTFWISLSMLSCNQNPNKPNSESTKQQSETQLEIAEISEEFVEIEIFGLNKILTKIEVNRSAKEIMELYYPYKVAANEGNEKISIQEEALKNGNLLVTLIHDNFLDDSVKGEKHLMELKKEKGEWTVISIKKNWKCWEGRGHTDWGIELCL